MQALVISSHKQSTSDSFSVEVPSAKSNPALSGLVVISARDQCWRDEVDDEYSNPFMDFKRIRPQMYKRSNLF